MPASFGSPPELPLEPPLEVEPVEPELELELVLPLPPLEPLGDVPDEPSSSAPGSVPDCELPAGPNSSVLLAPLHATMASRSDDGASRFRNFIMGSRGEVPR